MSKRSIDQGDQSKRQQRELNNLADSQSVDEVIRAEPEQQSVAAIGSGNNHEYHQERPKENIQDARAR